jgi:hypothetical protein
MLPQAAGISLQVVRHYVFNRQGGVLAVFRAQLGFFVRLLTFH